MPHLKATLIHDKQTSRHLPNIHKATQHNSMTPEEDFFKKKSAASGGTRTHDTVLSRPSARASTAGWDESYNVIQIKARQGKASQSNLINRQTLT